MCRDGGKCMCRVSVSVGISVCVGLCVGLCVGISVCMSIGVVLLQSHDVNESANLVVSARVGALCMGKRRCICACACMCLSI